MSGNGSWHLAALSGAIENLLRIFPDLFDYGRERLAFSASLIFESGGDYPASVGDEVGHDQYVALVQDFLGLFGRGNVRALNHQTGLDVAGILGGNDVGPRSGHQDIAVRGNDRFAVAAVCASQVGDTLAAVFQSQQRGKVQTIRVHDRPARIRDCDQLGTPFGEAQRRMFADRAKALNGDPCALQLQVAERLRDFAGGRDTQSRRADFVKRYAADHAWQADGARYLIADPCHAGFVRPHVGAGNVALHVSDRVREGAHQLLLFILRHGGIGKDDCLAAAMWQASRRVFQSHRARQPRAFLQRDVGRHPDTAD